MSEHESDSMRAHHTKAAGRHSAYPPLIALWIGDTQFKAYRL